MLQWSIQHIKKKNLVSALMKFALLWKTDIQNIIKERFQTVLSAMRENSRDLMEVGGLLKSQPKSVQKIDN